MEKESIYVTKAFLPPLEEYVEEIADIWETNWLTNMGAKHEKLQERLKRFLGARNLKLVVNGHSALELALECLKCTGGEIITTPFTFASTTHAIVRMGYTPVFCDINPEDFTLDCNRLEELITKDTRAILPVHVYGRICDVEKIQEISEKYHLRVIYDAAHAVGMKYRGKGIGYYGDFSCFSFHATKVFNTIEGGAIAFKETIFDEYLNRLRDFGINGNSAPKTIGTNAKMNEFCAAMGLINIKHFEDLVAARKQRSELYLSWLGTCEKVYLGKKRENVEENYAYFPILFPTEQVKDKVVEALNRQHIYPRKYFSPPTNEFECYIGKYKGSTPIACDYGKRVLTLPLYHDLPLERVDEICRIIKCCI